MPIRPPQFDDLAQWLTPQLKDLPPIIIAIDGRDGDGKTTLGRFLAWYFNVTLIETDLYLLGDNSLNRRTDEVARVVNARMSHQRPLIVEGVGVLQLLKDVGRKADIHIYIRKKRTHWLGGKVAAMLKQYENDFCPWEHAHRVIELNHDG